MLSLCLLTLQLLGVPWAGQELPLQRIPSRQPIVDADDRELFRLTKPYGTPWLIFEPEEVQSGHSTVAAVDSAHGFTH